MSTMTMFQIGIQLQYFWYLFINHLEEHFLIYREILLSQAVILNILNFLPGIKTEPINCTIHLWFCLFFCFVLFLRAH